MCRSLPIIIIAIAARCAVAADAADEPLTIAVLNFANRGQGDPAWNWLSKGLADLAIGDLASQQLKVVSREQMEAMVHELEIKQAQTDPEAVARLLKVARCVHGSYLVTGTTVELNATLINASSGDELHTAAASGKVADVLDLEKKIAAEMADVLHGRRPGSIDPATLPRWTDSLPASQLLYDGVDRFDHGEYLEAWSYFRRARRQDAGYADALYWSARMMYYVQEYHQARIDLQSFSQQFPKHPRVGDAVMELINCAQLTASNADDVLRVLKMAVRLAPLAEVPNQFGTGISSNVAIYSAGLAAQILSAEEKYGQAFERMTDAMRFVPRDNQMFQVAFQEAVLLAVQHAERTGTVLALPERPRPKSPVRQAGARGKGNLDNHRIPPHRVIQPQSLQEAIGRSFHQFRVERPTIKVSFGEEALSGTDSTRYFCAPAGHFIKSLDFEFRYDPTVIAKVAAFIEEGRFNQMTTETPGMRKICVTPPPGQRLVPIRLTSLSNPDYSVAGVTTYRVTADLISDKDPHGTLILKPPKNFACAVSIDGVGLPMLTAPRRIENVPPGKYTLVFSPHLKRVDRECRTTVSVSPGHDVVVEAVGKARREDRAPLESNFDMEAISSPYEQFRMGANLGERHDLAGTVQCLRDNRDRLIVVWTMRRDLYLTISTDDGESWSPTEKLSPPVNSAHDERLPALLQDRHGRFVLAFVSDRNLQHAPCTYVCWSEDLKNFSAPRRLTEKVSQPVAVLETPEGGHVVYMRETDGALESLERGRSDDRWVASKSVDLLEWTEPIGILHVLRARTSTQEIYACPAMVVFIGQPDKIVAVSRYSIETKLNESTDGLSFHEVASQRHSADIASRPDIVVHAKRPYVHRNGSNWFYFVEDLQGGHVFEMRGPEIGATLGELRPLSIGHTRTTGYREPNTQYAFSSFAIQKQSALVFALPTTESRELYEDEPAWFRGASPLLAIRVALGMAGSEPQPRPAEMQLVVNGVPVPIERGFKPTIPLVEGWRFPTLNRATRILGIVAALAALLFVIYNRRRRIAKVAS